MPRIELKSKIKKFEGPNLLVADRVKGTFKGFRHEHYFTNVTSRTLLTDYFTYESPFGLWGKSADKLFLLNYLANQLKERNRIVKNLAETGPWKKIPGGYIQALYLECPIIDY
ncbi:SRPBCC family protein [Pareuzebyella sediminis]|uniref:SRPBCC family protein n=1 Tax=Pareuzebyella sediminis TaxID=2607998 RepID=UPI0011ECC9BD|nr:hypothetical protein [Pareuzebyella sediminis]